MAGSLVGALRVTLGLDSAQFAAGAAKAQSTSKRLGASLKAMGIVAAGLATGVAVAVRRSLNAMDEMGELAQKIGVPVESLSALKYAAEQSGGSFEGLQTALLQLSKNMVGSPQKFDALGVSLRDASGAMRPTADVMTELADKFAVMPDGAEKTALAMQLFGKSGAEMIGLLNGGSEGIKALTDEAAKLGIVISEDAAASAGRFNDSLNTLSTAAGGLGMQLAAALAPTLEKIAGYAVDLVKAFSSLSPETKEMIAQFALGLGTIGAAAIGFGALGFALRLITGPIGLIATGAALIYEKWDPITAWFSKFWDDIKIVTQYYWDKLKEWIGSIADWFREKWDGIATWFSDIWTTITTATSEAWASIQSAITTAINAVTAVWDGFVAKLQSAIQIAKDVGTAIAEALSLGEGFGEAKASGYGGLADSAAGAVASGLQIGAGLAEGIRQGSAAAEAEVGALSDRLKTRIATDWQIQSPSRVAAEYGHNIGAGLAAGVTESSGIVEQAVKGLNDTAEGAMSGVGDLGARIGDMFASAATNVLTGVESLSEAVGKLLQQLASMLINSAMKSLFGNIFDSLNLSGYATGTTSAAAGWAMVGEQGPELVNFGGGERVYNARDTARMGAGGGAEGGGVTQMVTQVYLDGEMILSQIDTPQGEAVIARVNRRLGY